MEQRRTPFIAALIFSISLLSLAVLASANAQTRPLNHHHHGGKHLGRGPLRTPNGQGNIGKSNSPGGVGHAKQNQTANINHNQGQPRKGYGHHSGGIGNAHQNRNQNQQRGQAHGHHSGGIANKNQNQNQNQVQAGKSNNSSGTGNEYQNQSGSGNGSVADYGNGIGRTIATGALAQEFLSAHNLVRKKFNQPPYTWDENLALYAQTYATKLYQDCKMIHSNGSYGENIFWGLNLHWKPMEAVTFWYEEYKSYDFNKHICAAGKKCGHFTQMVWRDSVRLGCAVVNCRPGTGMLIICEYDPPGNFENESPFDNNNANQ